MILSINKKNKEELDNEKVDDAVETNTSSDVVVEEELETDENKLIQNLFESNLKILTADGGFLHRPQEQQEIMALYENGVFLVSKSHMSDPYVLKLETYARLRDIKIIRKIPVSLETIRDAYKRASVKNSLNSSASSNLTHMQKDIVDLIKIAVKNDVSDIHIIATDVSAVVEMRKNGVLTQTIEWQSSYGHDFCAACFAMADASDSNYNPTEYQAARISNATIDLPIEVQALRLQFNPLAYGGRYMIARLLYNSKAGDIKKGVSHLG
ncbi:MAG: hypothetical protein N4A43_03730, partial [Alphaproteobacteria bacterium]|nr:hypothetical protein [Alphaproteobacteria bacterium]